MTLQEAIKSGKRFRRSSWNFKAQHEKAVRAPLFIITDMERGHGLVEVGHRWEPKTKKGSAETFTYDDVMAEDWEIVE